MVYVQRDANGLILRVERQPFVEMTDVLAAESEELTAWLKASEEVHARLSELKQTDLEMIRVFEDVVMVLVENGVIRFTDLPEAARNKLDERALARAEVEGLTGEIKGRLDKPA